MPPLFRLNQDAIDYILYALPVIGAFPFVVGVGIIGALAVPFEIGAFRGLADTGVFQEGLATQQGGLGSFAASGGLDLAHIDENHAPLGSFDDVPGRGAVIIELGIAAEDLHLRDFETGKGGVLDVLEVAAEDVLNLHSQEAGGPPVGGQVRNAGGVLDSVQTDNLGELLLELFLVVLEGFHLLAGRQEVIGGVHRSSIEFHKFCPFRGRLPGPYNIFFDRFSSG